MPLATGLKRAYAHRTTGPPIMTDDEKLKLRQLKAAPIRRPGDPLPEPLSEDIVPELRGETAKLVQALNPV